MTHTTPDHPDYDATSNETTTSPGPTRHFDARGEISPERLVLMEILAALVRIEARLSKSESEAGDTDGPKG